MFLNLFRYTSHVNSACSSFTKVIHFHKFENRGAIISMIHLPPPLSLAYVDLKHKVGVYSVL